MTFDQRVATARNSDAIVTAYQLGHWTVIVVMTGNPWRENCYVVIDEPSNQAVIVDPGCQADLIVSEIRQRGVVVRHVLLTHGHHDHVGAVTSVCEALGISCLVNEHDARLLRQATLYAFRFSGKHIETPKPVEFFRTDKYLLGNHSVRIHHAPGHTKGGVVFEFPGFAITGDTLLYEHVGRTDLPGGDAQTLRDTVDSLLTILPETAVLFAGHGRTWTMAEAREWWRSAGGTPAPLDNFAAHDA